VAHLLQQLWNDEQGQDIAEYAVMLAVILVIVVGTIASLDRTRTMSFHKLGARFSKRSVVFRELILAHG